jgi:hypothetical protein
MVGEEEFPVMIPLKPLNAYGNEEIGEVLYKIHSPYIDSTSHA